MLDLKQPYPVPVNSTWNILDSSKLSEYMTCPRKFFYRYVLGWRLDSPQHDLKFGECWHYMMEELFRNGYSASSIQTGFDKFLEVYREDFPEELDIDHDPKNPGNALKAATQYVKHYEEFDKFKVLDVEVCGGVDIDWHDWLIHFRIDAVIEQETGDIEVWDHKTSKYKTSFWVDQWALRFQMLTYIHAAHCYYGDNVKGGVVNGTFFRKSSSKLGNDFLRATLRKTPVDLEAWRLRAVKLIARMEEDFDLLLTTTPEDTFMLAFDLDTESCTKYMRTCPYHSLCCAWHNPVAKIDRMPTDFVVEFWNPLDVEKGRKVIS